MLQHPPRVHIVFASMCLCVCVCVTLIYCHDSCVTFCELHAYGINHQQYTPPFLCFVRIFFSCLRRRRRHLLLFYCICCLRLFLLNIYSYSTVYHKCVLLSRAGVPVHLCVGVGVCVIYSMHMLCNYCACV